MPKRAHNADAAAKTAAPGKSRSKAADPAHGEEVRPPLSRKERLRDALPATVELLHKRRADMIEEGFIDDYVALHWLEWHGGGLRLTITGSNVCAQVAAALRG